MNDHVCLISVIIPTYNRVHVLPRAIDSIIAQTYPHWELLIVDDGSDDGTEKLVTEYILKDDRIQYFKRPDDRLRGGNACRNIGAEKSNGRYITYLDSDDYYQEQRLQRCAEFIVSTEADCFVSGRRTIFSGKMIEGRSRPFKSNESAIDYLLSRDTLTSTSSYVVKREVLKVVHWDETLLRSQDWDFFIQVAKYYKWDYLDNFDVVIVRIKGENKYMHIPSCLKVYNQHKHDISNTQNANHYLRIMMEYCSKHKKNIKYADNFYCLLVENKYRFTMRDKFQIYFPHLFYWLYRLKRTVHNPYKNFLRS